jgi:thiol-disulfide isomerase/thioredoxin
VKTLVCLLAGSVVALGADPLPRYHFTPGQELTWQEHSEFKFQDGSFITDGTSQIWVAGQNADGTWRLVEKTETTMHRVQDHSSFTEPDDQRVNWTRGDVTADGRAVNVESSEEQIDSVPGIFPLPANDQEMKSGWQDSGFAGQKRSFTVTSSAAPDIVIHLVSTSPTDAIYLSSASTDITFDLARGLPVAQASTSTQGYGFVGKSVGTGKLVSVTAATAGETRQLDADLTVYLAAKKQVKALFSAEAPTAAQITAAGEQAKAIYQKARAAAVRPDFQQLIDRDLAQIAETVKYESEAAAKRGNLLGAPAAAWTTTDLQGQAHALADYRGKIVVLDFWYRGCGWCMLAMPQVKEVAAHYAERPVAVLAMTTDTPASKDADFVAQKMQLAYPTLYAKQIAADYHINGFPTLLILDQAGVVRGVHVGYSPTLRDDVEKKIDALLAAPPK